MYCVGVEGYYYFFCSDIQAYLSGFWLCGMAEIYSTANASIWKSNDSKSCLQHGVRATEDIKTVWIPMWPAMEVEVEVQKVTIVEDQH